MGCSLGALLSSKTSPYSDLLSDQVLGLIAICPVAEAPDEKEAAQYRKLLAIPGPIFDAWRRWDRRGGTESTSVARFVGIGAEAETKKLQVRFNEQSRTPVWRRMAFGALPSYSNGKFSGGLPGASVWAGLQAPVFLIAGEADPITSATNVIEIAGYIGRTVEKGVANQATLATKYDTSSNLSPTHNTHVKHLKTLILPAPASHALLYAPRTSRPLSGHIQTFLSAQVDPRLSLGWQLSYLCTEGKWDVKNLKKWEKVEPVSRPINGIFRAMKTLREVDETHSPRTFVKDWAQAAFPNGKDGEGAIIAVVDISHENPVYDPRGLENGGIAYRKFPTVSKQPPTLDEVKHFIDIIDGLREEFPQIGANNSLTGVKNLYIAIHCHYGFNRTGFFIVAYLIEKLGFKLHDALKEFKIKRPPGIRHQHFIDELWARYWTLEDQ